MNLHCLAYELSTGWSAPFPDLSSPSTLVLAFGGSRYFDEPAPLQDLCRAFPDSHVIGCSTSGEIFDAEVRDDSLAVAVLELEHTAIRSARTNIGNSEDSYQAGKELAQRLGGPDLRGVFVLSDGVHINGSELVRGLSSVLPAAVPITGGLAGDGERFERTWVLAGGVPVSGAIVAVGFYGDRVQIGHGSRGGWDIFGPERQVTSSRGNVLFELDGNPALDLYKDYLGERAAGLPATGLLFPLSLRTHQKAEKSLVRTILAIDETEKSLTFAGDIPEGSLAQLMRANFDRLVHGASGAARMTRESPDAVAAEGATLAIAISCVGRRLVLGERIEEEVEATLENLPPGTQQVGFYSYGEISPHASGSSDLHNQTMTLTTISES